MTDQRFDVVYREEGCTIEPHFCREWDEDGGCYGSNPAHGFSIDEAADCVAEHYEQLAKQWREKKAYDYVYYKQGERIYV